MHLVLTRCDGIAKRQNCIALGPSAPVSLLIASLGPFPAENTTKHENSQTFHGFLKREPVLALSHERGGIPAPDMTAVPVLLAYAMMDPLHLEARMVPKPSPCRRGQCSPWRLADE
jgi:hypothetical protein